jgi:hypothetical protein
VTTAIAIYAACVATAALALELVSEWRSWSTRVEVKVQPRRVLQAGQSEGEPVIAFTHPDQGPPRGPATAELLMPHQIDLTASQEEQLQTFLQERDHSDEVNLRPAA